MRGGGEAMNDVPNEDSLLRRLAQLRDERAQGMATLAELQRKQDDLRATLLRVDGAIQVIEELLGAAGDGAAAGG